MSPCSDTPPLSALDNGDALHFVGETFCTHVTPITPEGQLKSRVDFPKDMVYLFNNPTPLLNDKPITSWLAIIPLSICGATYFTPLPPTSTTLFDDQCKLLTETVIKDFTVLITEILRGPPGGGPPGGHSEKLWGNVPIILTGHQSKVEEFLLQWDLYEGINVNNPITANPFQKAMLFLTVLG
ncbi:hypothetical protein EI94DRAFT_1796021 [Lactarius quietus]|nr:hypothetical protein EI94DRAFT_1796021 [Lactarius quietus]